MKKIILLFSIMCFAMTAMAQKKSISGVVTDVDDVPVIGASIVNVENSLGTISDIDGKFSLEVSPKGSLKISFIGYKTQVVRVAGKSFLKVVLEEDANVLSEVVVTGYGGTQLRSKLTNSIETVDKKALQNGQFTNPAQALSGAIPGVKVMQTSGNPRSVPTIIMRGGTNIDGSGSPLIVVDGQVRSDMGDINPEDIASIDVLKDAGATAIYGARAADGVVLINTKRGKAGATQISVSAKVGLNYRVAHDKFLGAEDYLYWMRSGMQNSAEVIKLSNGSWRGFTKLNDLNNAMPFGTGNLYFDKDGVTPLDGNKNASAVWSPMFLDDTNAFLLDKGYRKMTDPVTGKEIIFSEMDWEEALFRAPAVTQDYSLTLSGGNEKGGYYLGVGYNNSEGLPIGSFYKKITSVFNADYKLTKWLHSYTNFSFSNSNWFDGMVLNTVANYFGREPAMPPTQRKYNADGELLMGKGSGNDYNPSSIIDSFKEKHLTTRFSMGQNFQIDILKGLQLKLSAMVTYDELFEEKFTKDYMASAGAIVKTRKSSNKFSRNLNQTYNAVLTYDLDFLKEHHLNVMAGTEYYDAGNYGFSAAGEGAPTDDFQDLEYTVTDENKRTIDSFHSKQRILSFFGRVNYDYMDRYLFSFTCREDEYSKLIDNRWGFFPGVSAGWVFSKENFMKPMASIVSFAKLRVSYGVNGNVSGIGAYDLQGLFKATDNYDGNSSIMISTLPNLGLRWERSNTLEGGIDLGFLENRINANLTVYNRLNVDKFASIPMPGNSGVTSIKSNQGKIRNNGVELALGFKVLRKKDFTWDINANISYNVNKIMQLPDNGLVRNNQNAFQVYDPNTKELIWVGGYQEGQRPGDLYAFGAKGIYRSEEEVMEKAADLIDKSTSVTLYGPNAWNKLSLAEQKKGLPIQAGDVIWEDVNGDGVIDVYDKVKVGNATPKWLGGLNTSFTWKGLSLDVRMDYALGFYQMEQRKKWHMGAAQGQFNTVEDVKDTWTPENPNARYPKFYVYDSKGKGNFNRASSMFAYNASYLAFREVTLSYRLPAMWVQRSFMKDLSFSVTGQNLGYLTKSQSFSPESTSLDKSKGAGETISGYSLPRTVIFGVKATF